MSIGYGNQQRPYRLQLGADPLPDLADHAALPDDGRAARGGGGAHSRLITSEIAIVTEGLGREISVTEAGGAVAIMCRRRLSSPALSASLSILAPARWSGGSCPGIRPFASTQRERNDERCLRIGAPGDDRAGASAALIATWWDHQRPAARASTLPPLETILHTFVNLWLSPQALPNVVPSLLRFAVGVLAAAILGVAIGIAVGASRNLRNTLEPVLEFLRAIPAAGF